MILQETESHQRLKWILKGVAQEVVETALGQSGGNPNTQLYLRSLGTFWQRSVDKSLKFKQTHQIRH